MAAVEGTVNVPPAGTCETGMGIIDPMEGTGVVAGVAVGGLAQTAVDPGATGKTNRITDINKAKSDA